MTKVTAQMSVSLDGFYAGAMHTGDGGWLESAEAHGFFRITRWATEAMACLLYTSPSPRDQRGARMPSSA